MHPSKCKCAWMLNRKHLAVEENACVNEAGCIKWFLCSRRVKKCRIRTSLLLLLCFFFFHCLLFTFLCVLCPFVAFFCLRVFSEVAVCLTSQGHFLNCVTEQNKEQHTVGWYDRACCLTFYTQSYMLHNSVLFHQTISQTAATYQTDSGRLNSDWYGRKLNDSSECTMGTVRRGDVPLDLNALGSVYVVAFSVCGKVLGVGRGSRLKILGILGHFQPFGFLSWFITELYQCHHHGQTQPSDQNIEDTSHIA